MLKTEGKIWINNIRQKWIAFQLLQIIAITAAISLIIGPSLAYFFNFSIWITLAIFLILTLVYLLIKPVWKISDQDISRYVNSLFPELEESAELFLKSDEDLTLLQKLQADKLNKLIPGLQSPKEPVKRFFKGLGFLLLALLLSILIVQFPGIKGKLNQKNIAAIATHSIKENIPAEISNFNATIIPPAYTGNAERSQKQFSLRAEAGAKINWQIETNVQIKKLKIIFNDKETGFLKALNKEKTKWSYSKILTQPGFYQLELDGKKSDLYQIEVIPDLPVVIKINQPKQRTTIDIGQPQRINLNLTLSDDYGINDAFISATMASGKGEGVSFTEKKLTFNTSFSNKKNVNLDKLIDLKTLGMKPGDELYFFIKAMDNHGQSSRSDVYFVSIVDTTELMSLAGMTSGVNLVPEYFRSQRQIIIDTEKLLKEQGTITADAFKIKSNELGVDQKLLRLRYGQFLGEENETEIGGEHDEDHEPHEEKFGDVAAIMDKYSHKHDIAEDPTFFEPEIKKQLKAVLTEMWNSELRLRTYKPQEALPYEYKALRLLKDLQQKSRAYVAKTTVKTPNLKPEKRLSGELGQITQPVQKMNFEQKEQRTAHLKIGLSVLENRKAGKRLTEADKFLLGDIEKYMIGAAADNPSNYLKALTSLRKLSANNKLNVADIDLVQKAIQKMIKDEPVRPRLQDDLPASALYQNYFKNLNKAGR